MTNPVVFYTNALTQTACERYPEQMAAIAAGVRKNGDNREKLRGNQRIYSVRLNQKGRIIYTYFKHEGKLYPLILEADENHDYSTKYLDGKVYRDFLAKHGQAFIDLIESEPEPEPDPDPESGSSSSSEPSNNNARISFRPIHIIGAQALELSEEQTRITAPALVEGPGGSGKTCVAFRLLEQNSGEKVLYLTQSNDLADHVRRLWAQSRHLDENNGNVDIFTYEELIQQGNHYRLTPGSAEKQFLLWFAEYDKKSKFAANLVYQECRIISGYQKDDYLKAGGKQTIFQESEERGYAYKAYQKWMEHCQANQLNFAEFTDFENEIGEDQQYKYVFVDEAQDLSLLQIKLLIKLASNHQIVYCLDPRQSISDDNPKLIYLQQIFHAHRVQIKVVQLNAVYRSPINVMKVAEKINDLRIAMTPPKKKEAEIDVRRKDEGEVVWLDAKAPESFAQIEQMAKNKNVCIIASEEDKQKLISCGFAQVFTIEDIKGLQYETVIIYNMMSGELYKEISKNIANGFIIKDPRYSSPLSKLFTAMTRAERSVYFYQENPRPVQKLIDELNSVVSTTNSHEIKQETSRAEWLEQADSLYREYPDQALAILRNNIKMTQPQIDDWVRNKQVQPAMRSESVVVKRQPIPPAKAAVFSNVHKNKKKKGKKPAAKTSTVQDAGSSSTSSLSKPATLNQLLLSEAIKSRDFKRLQAFLKISERMDIDWNVEVDGVTALSVVCQDDTPDSIVVVHSLIHFKNIDVNFSSGNTPSVFYTLLKDKKYNLAKQFLASCNLMLEQHILCADADVEMFASRLYEVLMSMPMPRLEPAAVFFKQHSPIHLLRLAKHLFRNDPENNREKHFELSKMAAEAGCVEAQVYMAEFLRDEFYGVVNKMDDASQKRVLTLLVQCQGYARSAINNGSQKAKELLANLQELCRVSLEDACRSAIAAMDPEDGDTLQDKANAIVQSQIENPCMLHIYLLMHGKSDFRDAINWNYQDKKTGMTLLMLMCRSPQFGELSFRMAKELIAAKNVNVMLKDKKGNTAYIYMVLCNLTSQFVSLFDDHPESRLIEQDLCAREKTFVQKIKSRIAALQITSYANAARCQSSGSSSSSSTSVPVAHARSAGVQQSNPEMVPIVCNDLKTFLQALTSNSTYFTKECFDSQNQADGTTALMQTCRTLEPERNACVKILIDDYKVDLALVDHEGQSAFIHACLSIPNDELIELFLKDETFDTLNHIEPLKTNAQKDRVFEALFDGDEIEAVVKKHKPAFHAAAQTFFVRNSLKKGL